VAIKEQKVQAETASKQEELALRKQEIEGKLQFDALKLNQQARADAQKTRGPNNQ
jgi:hypothetical protein